MNHCFTRMAVLFLVITMTVSLVGADLESAMVSGGSDMLLNGRSSMGGVIATGDKLENRGNASARIMKSGLVIEVAPHSAVSYDPREIGVASGAVSVRTSNKLKATFHDVTVETTQGTAQFMIGETKTQHIIAAVRGSLKISDGANSYELPEGSALVQDRTPAPAVTGTDAGQKSEPRGGKLGKGKTLPGWAQVTIIGGTIGGVLGGLGLAGTFDSSDPVLSPSQP